MQTLNYTVIFDPLEEGVYMVELPALPGVITYGDKIDNAREMAVDAIKCHLEGLCKDGAPIPDDINIKTQF